VFPTPVPKIRKLFLCVAVVVAGDDGERESQVTANRGRLVQGKEGDRVKSMPPNRMDCDARRQSIMLSQVVALGQCEWNGLVGSTLAETSSELDA
jgi:hypothetical protein